MLQGFLLGLSVNIGCLGVCSPVLLPYLLSQENKAIFPIIRFMAGRLIAYLFFAATFGYVGLYFDGRINPYVLSTFTIILSLWLILYAFGKSNLNIPFCRWTSRFVTGTNFPLFAGIVMGLNICPPFLLGLNQTLFLGSVLKSIIFFLGFYLGSSIWLALLLFAEPLAKKKAVRVFGRLASALVGLWFLYRGVVILADLI